MPPLQVLLEHLGGFKYPKSPEALGDPHLGAGQAGETLVPTHPPTPPPARTVLSFNPISSFSACLQKVSIVPAKGVVPRPSASQNGSLQSWAWGPRLPYRQ